MFKSILVATDGSDPATKALEIAADLAQKYDADLAIVHVVTPGPVPEQLKHFAEVEHVAEKETEIVPETALAKAPVIGPLKEAEFEAKVKWSVGERLLEAADRQARSKGAPRIKTFLAEGDPAEQILARADLEGADLIAMGTRGFGALKELLMGGVSHRVSEHANCTCLTVR